jgi:hypothetical protein
MSRGEVSPVSVSRVAITPKPRSPAAGYEADPVPRPSGSRRLSNDMHFTCRLTLGPDIRTPLNVAKNSGPYTEIGMITQENAALSGNGLTRSSLGEAEF